MTEQICDKLTYNGKEYDIHNEPLYPYLIRNYPTNLFRPSNNTIQTDCWRGYVGHWAIEDDKLYLLELDCLELPPRNALDDIFSGQQKVFAEWFSGTIHTFSDKMYMYLEFKIEKGHLVEVLEKESKYKSEYMKILDEL